MHIKEELTLIQRATQSVSEYLNIMKSLVDKLIVIDSPIFINDINLYIFNGIEAEFYDISTTIKARETSLAFEELHNMLISFENHLKQIDYSTSRLTTTINVAQGNCFFKSFCFAQSYAGYSRSNQQCYGFKGKSGQHILVCQLYNTKENSVKTCSKVLKPKSTNCAATGGSSDKKWLMDSTISHHITSNLANLSIHSEHDGTYKVIIGDVLSL